MSGRALTSCRRRVTALSGPNVSAGFRWMYRSPSCAVIVATSMGPLAPRKPAGPANLCALQDGRRSLAASDRHARPTAMSSALKMSAFGVASGMN